MARGDGGPGNIDFWTTPGLAGIGRRGKELEVLETSMSGFGKAEPLEALRTTAVEDVYGASIVGWRKNKQ